MPLRYARDVAGTDIAAPALDTQGRPPSAAVRAPEAEDLAAAHRGLRMDAASDAMLKRLVRRHERIREFASQVVAVAARNELRGRLRR